MLALPPAAAPAPRRQILVGTAIACAAGVALMGGMLALWLQYRQHAIDAKQLWVPEGVAIQLVPANIMLLVFIPIGVFAQWAVYAAKRDDKPHTGAALGLVGLLGIAFINAQANVWARMEMPAGVGNAADGTFNTMFYTITGVMLALAIIGVVFSAITAFRYLGGRTVDREVVAAHALYWYFLSFVFAMLWFVVYVTK
jgi:heme/copper-type cytochrome/quinol oxidase subunit 3